MQLLRAHLRSVPAPRIVAAEKSLQFITAKTLREFHNKPRAGVRDIIKREWDGEDK